MTNDVFQQLLGVPSTADPFALLGIRRGPVTPAAVDAALRTRLALLYEHPSRETEGADVVRGRLRDAATYLRQPEPRDDWPMWLTEITVQRASESRARQTIRVEPSPNPPDESPAPRPAPVRAAVAIKTPRTPGDTVGLTPFDQSVLAILVGSGGWNATSRARLVALAGANNVTVDGLVKVVSGLSRAARGGSRRFGVAEITAGAARLRTASDAPAPSLPAAFPFIFERIAPQFRDQSALARIKLSLLFGIPTIIAGIITLRLLVPTAAVREHENDGSSLAMSGSAGTVHAPSDSQSDAARHETARFVNLPSFMGNGVPPNAVNAADQLPQLPAHIDEVVRKLSITDDPSEAVYRNWTECIRLVGEGWVLTDASSREAIEQGVADVFYAAADTPSVSDRLMADLAPPAGRLTDPLDLWRGAWKSRVLARLARSSRMPRVVSDRARFQLEVALGAPGYDPELTPDAVAALWLDQAIPRLVEVLEYAEQAYDLWELWIAAHRKIERGSVPQRSLMRAVQAIVATETDLSQPGPSLNVLGRLLSMTDYRSSRSVQETFATLFNDADNVTAHDLWVFTSLLATYDWAPWFEESFVVPGNADVRYRRRMRDRMLAAWPVLPDDADMMAAGAGPLQIDEEAAARWLDAYGRLSAAPNEQTNEAIMMQLVATARLNEAAVAIADHRIADAFGLLDALWPAQATATSAGRRGQTIGRDGDWTATFEAAKRRAADRINALRALRAASGTDLGPVDAATLVRAAYREPTRDVQSLAKSLIVERFNRGPNVAMELLDQSPEAPRTRSVSDMIRRLTGITPPPTGSESWRSVIRAALVQHALWLRTGDHNEIDRLQDLLARSVVSRAAALGQRSSDASGPVPDTPQAAADLLATAWEARAMRADVLAQTVDDLADLHRRAQTRRRLAHGPVQQFVAGQLAALDFSAHAMLLRQPRDESEVRDVLEASALARGQAEHVLQQALVVEHSLASLWRIRFSGDSRLVSFAGGDP